jgi:hypothetical protein
MAERIAAPLCPGTPEQKVNRNNGRRRLVIRITSETAD